MICTFYSYKGGVGRSMAMANVADLLARRGLRVLMVDFDLEAPGLEQFFQINQEGIRRRRGLLDLLLMYKQAMSLGRADEAEFQQLANFISPVYERLPGGGRLDILAAGQRQEPEDLARYALQLRTFDWQDFYFNWQGELFFEWFRRSLTPDPYNLVLVDSRTGVTEMGGICGYQLADTIVMMCAANHQNVEGTANMLRDFRSPEVEALRRGRLLNIVVVPARIEQRDAPLLNDFFTRFDATFADVLPPALASAGLGFRELMIPYDPHFAFQERVLTDPDDADYRRRIADAFTQLANAIELLTDPGAGRVDLEGETLAGVARAPSPSSVATPAEARFDPAKRFAGYDVFLDSSTSDADIYSRVSAHLQESGLSVFVDRYDASPGEDRRAVVEQAVFHSRAFLLCIGREGLSPYRLATVESALAARSRGQSLTIIPVLLPGAEFEMLSQNPELAQFQAIDLRRGLGGGAVETLVRAAVAARSRTVEATVETRAPFRGLDAFEEHESDLFFGRTAVIAALVEKLREQRAVIAVGPPRSGKTSLIHAGLIPSLRREGGVDPLQVVVVNPTEGLDKLQAVLSRESSGALLVCIDDLESLFRAEVSDPERRATLEKIVRFVENPPSDVRLVATLRSDYLDQMRALAGEMIDRCVFLIPLLTPDELRTAIEGPVEKVGLVFEPGLAERILADIRDQPGALAWLQLLLTRLWDERRDGWLTNAAYDRIGGIAGVLASQAEEFYQRLAEPEQLAVQRCLLRLVRAGSTGRDTRRAVEFGRLAMSGQSSGSQAEVERTALRDMIEVGLVVVSIAADGKSVVEVAHEGLLRNWTRLGDWLAEERAFLLWRDRLATAMDPWSSTKTSDYLLTGSALAEAMGWARDRRQVLGADEIDFIDSSGRRRDHKIRRTIAVLMSVVVFLSGLVWWALGQRSAAEEARLVALHQKELAEQARLEAEKKTELAQETIDSLRSIAKQNDVSAAAQQQIGTLADNIQVKIDDLEKKRGSGYVK